MEWQDERAAARAGVSSADAGDEGPPTRRGGLLFAAMAGFAPPGQRRMLTTHEVADAAAWRIVGWYRARWVIEQLFRVLQSHALQLEDSQMARAERLTKLAAATKAACIGIQLRLGLTETFRAG